MSFKVMQLAWPVSDLTPAQKAVLIALSWHANDDGRKCYPSVETLMQETSYAERTVRRALGDLRDLGFIEVVQEARYHHPTGYQINLGRLNGEKVRPARDAPHDLPESAGGVPENTEGVPESAERPARDAPKLKENYQDKPKEEQYDGDSQARADGATLDLVDYWQDLTGSFAPTDERRRAFDYIGPLNRLWIRVGRDLDVAKQLLREKRDHMLSEGKTPYRPAAIVPAIFADLDGVDTRASPRVNGHRRNGDPNAELKRLVEEQLKREGLD